MRDNPVSYEGNNFYTGIKKRNENIRYSYYEHIKAYFRVLCL